MPLYSSANGKAERKHRLITETRLTLLVTTSLLLDFWDEAFLIATYVINRLPSFNNNGESPFEIINRQKTILFFHEILRLYNKNKFDFKSHKCVFLGFTSNQKGYKCLSPSGKVYVYVFRDVIFYESIFLYHDLFVKHNTSAPPIPIVLVPGIPRLFTTLPSLPTPPPTLPPLRPPLKLITFPLNYNNQLL